MNRNDTTPVQQTFEPHGMSERYTAALDALRLTGAEFAAVTAQTPLNYVAHDHNALRARVEHAVEEIARLACEVDGQHLHILTESLDSAAKAMQAAIVSQWGELGAHEHAALLRVHPKSH